MLSDGVAYPDELTDLKIPHGAREMTTPEPFDFDAAEFPPIGSGGEVGRTFSEYGLQHRQVAARNIADVGGDSVDHGQLVGRVHGNPDKVMGRLGIKR